MRNFFVVCFGLFFVIACTENNQPNSAVSKLKKSQTTPNAEVTRSTNFNDRNQIVALAFVAYAGDSLTQTDARVDQILQGCVANELSRQPILAQRFSLVWGPSVYRFRDEGLDDNMMYAVNDLQEPGHIIIGIRGTNGGAALDWLVEDFYVNQTQSWHYAKPFDANIRISQATSIGLTALQNMTGSVSGGPSKLNDYLTAQVNSGSLSRVTVTGHSLAGALAPTFALWLKDTESNWNSSGNPIPINVLPIAGATPGNADFANYYNSKLGDSTDRLHNPFDVVPHAWYIPSMEKLDDLYVKDGFDIRPSLIEEGAFDFGIELAKDMDYLQIKDKQAALPGVINPNAKDSGGAVNYAGQMLWQHHCGYYNALGMTSNMYTVNTSCVTQDFCQKNPTDSQCEAMQKPLCNAVPIR